jgi:hypothetical protein
MNGGGEGVVKRIFRRRHLFPHELMPVAAVEGLSCFKQSCVGVAKQTQEEEDTRRRRHKKKKTQEEEETRRNKKEKTINNHEQPETTRNNQKRTRRNKRESNTTTTTTTTITNNNNQRRTFGVGECSGVCRHPTVQPTSMVLFKTVVVQFHHGRNVRIGNRRYND